MKTLWISSLAKDEAAVQALMASAKTYGLQAAGHFWTDDPQGAAWSELLDRFRDREVSAWVIQGPVEAFGAPRTRTGLAWLALAVRALKGGGFPIVLVPGGPLDADTLPTPLRSAEVLLPGGNPGLKLVALANRPAVHPPVPYRLDVHALSRIGLFVEIGPAPGEAWAGALFGLAGGEILRHAVGPKGRVPERCTLEYPVKGLRLEVQGREFLAWGVRNRLEEDSSYFVQVQGDPEAMLFGPFPEEESGELFSLRMT